MSKNRKSLFKKMMDRGKDISKPPNIKKKTSDAETEEQDIREKMDGEVPEDFKQRMERLSKEELIADLFFTKYELMQTKRNLELTTFKLSQHSKDVDLDLG